MEKLDTFHEEFRSSVWFYRVTVSAGYTRLRAEKKYKSNVSFEEYVSYDEDRMLKGVKAKDWSD